MTEQACYATLGVNIQTDSGLESCPFCGSPVRFTTIHGDFMESYPGMFECTNQDCGARVMFKMTGNWTREREKDLWNRRVGQ